MIRVTTNRVYYFSKNLNKVYFAYLCIALIQALSGAVMVGSMMALGSIELMHNYDVALVKHSNSQPFSVDNNVQE